MCHPQRSVKVSTVRLNGQSCPAIDGRYLTAANSSALVDRGQALARSIQAARVSLILSAEKHWPEEDNPRNYEPEEK